jgi:hypothetical protein
MFQLWEMESANLVGSYETEDAALAVVRKAMDTHGRDAIESLALIRESARGRLSPVAEGPLLADLALERTSPAA